ncbi:MAG: hypothetical protein ACLUD2_10435 [Clostridium sp.]
MLHGDPDASMPMLKRDLKHRKEVVSVSTMWSMSFSDEVKQELIGVLGIRKY